MNFAIPDAHLLNTGDFKAIMRHDVLKILDIMARFVVDDQGQPVDVEKATAMIDAVPEPDLNAEIERFAEVYRAAHIPLANSGG